LQRLNIRSASNENDVRAERDQFRRVSACKIDIAAGPRTVLVSDVASFGPTQLLQRLAEYRMEGLSVRISFESGTGEHADAAHALVLLRPRRERPRRRAAEQRDERAAFHVWMAPAWQEKM
jgi:hypothetical protein